MKKILISALATAVLFGCQETIENVASVSDAPTFEALVEGFSADTKTSLTELNNIVWSEGDNLAIFQGCSVADKYQLTPATAGTANGNFTLVSDNSGDINGDFTSGMEIATNIALYPYAENLSCANARLTDTESGVEVAAYTISGVVLPEVQNYVADSFGETSFPMVAMTESIGDHILKFKNVCGAMKLQLKGTQVVKSIKIEGGNSEKLSGAATITTYPDADLAPVIRMASDASTSVTLDCGDGVQLSESAATEFIIALPPVLFSKGFNVTVTTSEDVTKVIETSAANTILRSSILVMPEVMLGDAPSTEEPGDEVDVELIVVDRTSLTMAPGTSYKLEWDVDPAEVTDPTLTWTTSDAAVTQVDQTGKITAVSDGTATITVRAVGGVSATCLVKVIGLATPTVEYKDGDVSYGYGIAIGDVVWAPVNCGYEAATSDYKGYQYGKLYQWGRKYGQGYDANDASYPSGDNLLEGPVMPSVGQSEENKDVFFTVSEEPYDWCKAASGKYWDTQKTATDPCPEGWRIPTKSELSSLLANKSTRVVDEKYDQVGYYLSGLYSYIPEAPRIFIPDPGFCRQPDGRLRTSGPKYWSSYSYYSLGAYFLSIENDENDNVSTDHAYGFSVRCVQE